MIFMPRAIFGPNNGQPAATFGIIQSECADYNMTAGASSLFELD